MYYQLIAIPIIGAFIGYITNVIAIKLLFWPATPINIAGYKLQGLLPQRQKDIAASLGVLIEEQLLSVDDLLIQIDTPSIRRQITEKLVGMVRLRMSAMLPRFIPGRISQVFLDLMEKMIQQETPGLIDEVWANGKMYLQENVRFQTIVEEKINALDFLELERIIKGISLAEIRFIEILGGVLGLIIGLIQVLILLIFPL